MSPKIYIRPEKTVKKKVNISKASVRGKYNIISQQEKYEAVKLAQIHSIKLAAQISNVPEKNLKRWIKNGPERKKGAGWKIAD